MFCFVVSFSEYILYHRIIAFYELSKFLFVFGSIDIRDSNLETQFFEKDIHISFHTFEVFIENALYLFDGSHGVSYIIHTHLSFSVLISFSKYDNIPIVYKRTEESWMGSIDCFDFIGVHSLTISENSALIVKENLSGYDHLEIHLLINHGIKVPVKEPQLKQEKKGIYNPKRKMCDIGEENTTHTGKKNKESDNKKEKKKKNSLIEKIHKYCVRMLTFLDGKINILNIWLTSLNLIKPSNVDYYNYEPPNNIETQEYCDGNCYDIGIRL